MTFVTTWPDGTKSVKVNETAGAANMAYIQTKQRLDHYWGDGAATDGYHRKMDMPKSAPAPTLVNNGVLFAKDTSDLVTQTFYTNTTATYQVTPGVRTGTLLLTSAYQTLAAVPASVYGEIFMWVTTVGKTTFQSAAFRSNAIAVEAWSYSMRNQDGSGSFNLVFGNGSTATPASLNIKVRSGSGSNVTWQYRITYRDI